ncbi:MAG: hypothetical protein FPO08_04365 [Geobacter sp.]|nr:MAG: hypothetical protein FPO08_04365 [Geobacter sp.]
MLLRMFVVLVSFLTLTTVADAAGEKSLREALTASGNVRQVYAADDRSTLVIPNHTNVQGVITPEFVQELQALCPTPLEVKKLRKGQDPITGKSVERTEIVPFDGKEITEGLSCKGEFSVPLVFGETRTSQTMSAFFVKSFIMQHERSQPPVYKTVALPDPSKIVVPKEGPVTFLKETPIESSIGRGIVAAVDGLASLFGSKEVYFDDIDLLQYLAALAKKTGSAQRFVINQPVYTQQLGWQDHFEEVDTPKAMAYVFANQDRKKWFVSLNGPVKLVATMKHEGKGLPKSYIALDRGLEDVDFVPLGGRPRD